MTETTTETAYDPIPDLAWLLGAAQRQMLGYDAQGGIRTYANRLVEGLGLPELATAAEAYTAICKGLGAAPGRVLPVNHGSEKGATARFADFYTARYDDIGSLTRALIVETDEPMQVRPVTDRKVIIARA